MPFTDNEGKKWQNTYTKDHADRGHPTYADRDGVVHLENGTKAPNKANCVRCRQGDPNVD